MIFDCESEVFTGIYCSRAEAFVYLNHHQVWVILDKDDSTAFMREYLLADGVGLEIRFQGLEKFPKASF